MNRRELFQSLVGVAAVAGVPVKASAVDGDTKPALIVFETDACISQEVASRLVHCWEHALAGTPFAGVKTVVFDAGMRLSILDANGRPLNRRIEDEPADPHSNTGRGE